MNILLYCRSIQRYWLCIRRYWISTARCCALLRQTLSTSAMVLTKKLIRGICAHSASELQRSRHIPKYFHDNAYKGRRSETTCIHSATSLYHSRGASQRMCGEICLGSNI